MDVNGDGVVDEEDDLNGDGVVDEKDMKMKGKGKGKGKALVNCRSSPSLP